MVSMYRGLGVFPEEDRQLRDLRNPKVLPADYPALYITYIYVYISIYIYRYLYIYKEHVYGSAK